MISDALRTARTLLPSIGAVTPEQVTEAVQEVLKMRMYQGVDGELLTREIHNLFNIRIDEFTFLEAANRMTPWIKDRKADIWNSSRPTFWARYRDYLETEKNFAPQVLSRLDNLTDRILDGLFDPTVNGTIDKRGLVVGQVQSGKTSNYAGLICKAADAGFKFIIVLAGIHNNLRSQTQLRIDESFLGFDTQHLRAIRQNRDRIGVGKIDKSLIAHSLTSSSEKGDFTAGAAQALGLNFETNEPIIAVVKKNASVLNRLYRWLYSKSQETSDGRRVVGNKSLLVIDDEADHASINTSKDLERATRINELIRSVLRLFNKSGYVGYTATPFANIFIPIDDDNLFPRDFIVNLPAPSNYIGPETVFGFTPTEEDDDMDSVLPIITRIDDHSGFFPDKREEENSAFLELPPSLKLAIRCFILTCAVRIARGQSAVHNSMLVHVTRLIKWQRLVKQLVEDEMNLYARGIAFNEPEIIGELKRTFLEDNGSYKSFPTISQQILASSLKTIDSGVHVHSWEEVLPHLHKAASKIVVKEINGGSADALNYHDDPNGVSVIAVGGDKLSRGLTLEGLSISYYLRASRMYDTLMQMGRWFGYRPGYVDLCRLFISAELNEWFCHVTLASQQLRDEFDFMADVAGATPDQYALRVRTHPGVLQISASNKIRAAVEVQVSWSGRLVESYELCKNLEIIKSNYDKTVEFIKELGDKFEQVKSSYLFRDISIENVKEFLRGFQSYDNLKSASPSNLLRFIEINGRYNELNSWNVGIVSKSKTTKRSKIGGLDIGYIKRTHDTEKSSTDLYYIRKSHIISPDDEFIDLSPSEMEKALEETRRRWAERKRGVPFRPSGEVVRNIIRKPNRPLILIYLLDPDGADIASELPVVGYAISFPASDRNEAVSFAVNEQLLSYFNYDDEIDIIQEDDEDYENLD